MSHDAICYFGEHFGEQIPKVRALSEIGLAGHIFCYVPREELFTRTMISEILDNVQLAERWRLTGTLDAIAKRFQRLRALPKSNPRHLKAFKIGNQTRYRLTDILEYEDRTARKFRRGGAQQNTSVPAAYEPTGVSTM